MEDKMEPIKQKVKQYCDSKDYRNGLKTLAKLRKLHSGANLDLIKTAYEMLIYPSFYKSLSKNIDLEIQNGINEMIKYYG